MKRENAALFKWNIKESVLLPILMLFPLIVFVSTSFADVGFSSLSYVTFAAVVGMFLVCAFLYLRDGEMSRYGLYTLIFTILLDVFSALNFGNSDLKQGIYMGMEIWLFQMAFYYYRERIHVLIIAVAIAASVCVYLNFAHMMMHPELWLIPEEKINHGYLLGNNYNGMGFRFVVAITFSLVCMRYSWKWIFNVIPLMVLSILPLVLSNSKTSLTGVALLIVIMLIPSLKLQKLATRIVLFFVVLFQLFVVFMGNGLENNELANYIIVDVLEKDITFSLRTYLWDMSLSKIAESPIWGYGNLNYDWYGTYIHTTYGTGPCNLILCILLNGGIILLTLFVILFAISYHSVNKCNDRTANIIQAGLVCLMLMHLMESLSFVFVFYLMTLAYYYPHIQGENLVTNDLNQSTHS